MRYGQSDGRMRPTERQMITEGLSGTLVHLPVEVTEQVASLSAPIMAAFGVLMYATRLSTIEMQRRNTSQEDVHVAAAQQIFQQPISNQETIAQPYTNENVPDMNDVRSVWGTT